MPDLPHELRRWVGTRAERIQAAWQAAFGLELPSQDRLPGRPGGAASGMEGSADVFATGYDGAETTTVFLFDVSLFDGEDLLS